MGWTTKLTLNSTPVDTCICVQCVLINTDLCLPSHVYWTETQDGVGTVMRCTTRGTDTASVLRRSNRTGRRRRRRNLGDGVTPLVRCTCPPDMDVTGVFTLDHSMRGAGGGGTQIYVVEKDTGSVWRTDVNGCACLRVVKGSDMRMGSK